MDVKISLYWHRYKGDGKTWVARYANGKITDFLKSVEFEETNGTKSGGAYEGWKTYILEEGGTYLLHRPYTKTTSIRQLVKVRGGQIQILPYDGRWADETGKPIYSLES
jgi:hypothetical protein